MKLFKKLRNAYDNGYERVMIDYQLEKDLITDLQHGRRAFANDSILYGYEKLQKIASDIGFAMAMFDIENTEFCRKFGLIPNKSI